MSPTPDPPGSDRGFGEPSDFDQACSQAVRLLLRQQEDPLSVADEVSLAESLREIINVLPRLLAPRVAGDPTDVQDVSQEALARFVAAIGRGQVDPDASPAGYLLTIAANVVRDKSRRRPLPLPVNDTVLHDHVQASNLDDVAGLLDELASIEAIKSAIARAAAQADSVALEVVATWLDIATRTSRAPTTREVALVLGISKSTVSNALQRFRTHIRAES